jgi:hypothetical protein
VRPDGHMSTRIALLAQGRRRIRRALTIRAMPKLAFAGLAALLIVIALMSYLTAGRVVKASGGRCREVSHVEDRKGIRFVENLRLCYGRGVVELRGIDSWFAGNGAALADPSFRFEIESRSPGLPSCKWRTKWIEDNDASLGGSGWIHPSRACRDQHDSCFCFSNGVVVIAELWAIDTTQARLYLAQKSRIVVINRMR